MTAEILREAAAAADKEVLAIWYLAGAALVFFMQAGFAMVETGFTRAKNAGNIIMKNLMDFCIGTIVFMFLGFGIMTGENVLGGLAGLPGLGIFTDYANFDMSSKLYPGKWTLTFKIIDKKIGLRVTGEEETDGLDSHEHGLASAYAGFSIMDVSDGVLVENENTNLGLGVEDYVKAVNVLREVAVPVVKSAVEKNDSGMHKVVIIAKSTKYEALKNALNRLGVTGMTVTQVMGCGIERGGGEKYRGVEVDMSVLPKLKIEVVVGNIPVEQVIETAREALFTGHIGDGKIFVYGVQRVVKVRTGEENMEALNDVE